MTDQADSNAGLAGQDPLSHDDRIHACHAEHAAAAVTPAG
jgi:hypothetical protein